MSGDGARRTSALADRLKMFEQAKEEQAAPAPPRPMASRASDMAKRFEAAANASPAAASPLNGAPQRGGSNISERAKGLAFNPAMLLPGSKPPPLRAGSGASSTSGAGMGHLEMAHSQQPTPAGGGSGSGSGSADGGTDGGGGSGLLAPLPTASRPTRRPAGRKPKSRQQSSPEPPSPSVLS